MKPSAFEYRAPDTIDEAVDALADLGDAAKVLAGGQSLIPMMALRLAAFEHLVDVGRIDSLRGIERRADTVWVGAGTTESTVEHDPQVRTSVPLLARATPLIGHFQIRNRGTIGGSLAHADPAAEYPAVALALDAEIEVCSSRGRRTIAAADFFTGLWSTSMEPDELLVGVTFPVWSGRCGFALEEFARRRGDFAIAGAAVAVELAADDSVRRCAIGLIGLDSAPVRAHAAEVAAIGQRTAYVDADELGRTATAGLSDVITDLHGSSDYRRTLGARMVARAWSAAVEEARHA